VTSTAPTPIATSTGAAVPAPRPAAEQQGARRRQRPTSQYWDVFDACWRASDGRRA
jgi:hypothetical protein